MEDVYVYLSVGVLSDELKAKEHLIEDFREIISRTVGSPLMANLGRNLSPPTFQLASSS